MFKKLKFKFTILNTIAFSSQLRDKTIIVQLFRNTNSEKEFLNNIIKIIILGGGIVFLVSIGAGAFLAKRTMIPIVNAWEKQRQFVENASHEIRTPLTVVQSQLELILRKPEAKVIDNASYLAVSLSEIRRLSRLVSDLLTLARADSNVIEIEKKPVDISGLMSQVFGPYIEIAELEDKHIEIVLMDNLMVNCEEGGMHQLLIILLDNALKYTYKGGNIKINLTKEDNKCIIVVKDDGIGIKEEEEKLIFDRFYRGDKSRTRETNYEKSIS